VDRWLKDKVLLPPATTKCAVPKEAAGQGMLRAIAYGTELNMAYPPRPTDPKIPWEPDWNVKIRVKSMTTSMFGMPDMSEMVAPAATRKCRTRRRRPMAAPSTEEPKRKRRASTARRAEDVVVK